MSSLNEIRTHLQKSFLLNEKEVLVYQSCLEQGFLSPSQIARLTGIKRTTIYLVLEELKHKGLLVERIKGKRKVIGVAPPETLRRLVEREEEKVKHKSHAIENIIPLLENIQKTPGSETEIEILEGKTGAISLIENIIQAKEDIYWLGSLDTMLKIVDEEKILQAHHVAPHGPENYSLRNHGQEHSQKQEAWRKDGELPPVPVLGKTV